MIKRLVITGYKAHELGIFNDKHPGIGIIKKALEDRLTPLLDNGLEWVIVSGQPGVETWAAETVIDLQDTFPDLKFAVITPFQEQEKNWNEAKQEAYQFILAHADYSVSLTKRPYEAPWQFIERDKFLLRNSDGILIVYDEENDYYVCEVNLDEDEMGRFLRGTVNACPYYQSDDEYRIVRRQM